MYKDIFKNKGGRRKIFSIGELFEVKWDEFKHMVGRNRHNNQLFMCRVRNFDDQNIAELSRLYNISYIKKIIKILLKF